MSALHERLKVAQQLPAPALPVQATPFIGRPAELAAITGLLEDREHRLITLSGPGGVGKTRLALEAAGTVHSDYVNGVYFVALAAVDDVARLPAAVGAALGIDFQGKDLDAELFAYLANKDVLLVLDNLEQLLPAAASWVNRLLEAAPLVQALATSREPLGSRHEQRYTVEGLARETSPETLALSEAAALFAANAQRHAPAFTITADNHAAVAQICEQLAGLPLAIEFAAAWVHALPVATIAAEINEDFELLVARDDREERHASLTVVFEHSWRRLAERDREALLRLSLFRGGFTREAAQAAAGVGTTQLADLVSRSLVVTDAGAARYTLLETFRRYLLDKLDPASALFADAREAQCAYFINWVAALAGSSHDRLPGQAARAMLPEIDNLRQVWRWLLETSPLPQARIETLLRPLYLYYHSQSYFADGLEALRALATRLEQGASDAQTVLHAQCLIWMGNLAISLGQLDEARESLLAARSMLDSELHPAAYAMLLRFYSKLAFYEANYPEAQEVLGQALAMYTALGDETGEAITLRILGVVRNAQGNYEDARTHLAHSVALHRANHEEELQAASMNGLANTLCEFGEYQQALALYNECLVLHREANNRYRIGIMLNNIATVHIVLGQYWRAVELLDECYAICEQIGDLQGVGTALLNLGYSHLMEGDLNAAHGYLEHSLAVFEEVDFDYMEMLARVYLGQVATHDGHIARALALFQGVLRQAQAAESQSMLVRALAGMASLWDALGDPVRALAVARFVIAHETSNPEMQIEARHVEQRVAAGLDARALDAAETLLADSELDGLVAQALELRAPELER